MAWHRAVKAASMVPETYDDGSHGFFVVTPGGASYEIALGVSEECWDRIVEAFAFEYQKRQALTKVGN